MPAINIVVEGKVQGVSFRANAKRIAEGKNITGWVKNTDEGHVEIIANGTEKDLDEFVSWCKRGPMLANVTDVKVKPQAERDFQGFSIEI